MIKDSHELHPKIKMGTSRKGKNLLPPGANSSLYEQSVLIWKHTISPLDVYNFYYACV